MSKKAMRFNEGKPKWSLVDFKSLEPMVRVLEYGADKYSRDNWKDGLLVREIVESMLRHIFDFLEGEDLDSESGLPHVGHILCNAMFLSWTLENRPEFDDRLVMTTQNDYPIFPVEKCVSYQLELELEF